MHLSVLLGLIFLLSNVIVSVVVSAASDECVLSMVIPRNKIKSSCSDVESLSKLVDKNREDMYDFDKKMKSLKFMLVAEIQSSTEKRMSVTSRINRLEKIINQLIGNPDSSRTGEEHGHRKTDTTSHPHYYGRSSINNHQVKDEALADVPQLETIVEKYTLNAFRNVNNTISQEVDKRFKAYENNFNEDLQRSLDDSIPRDDIVQKHKKGVRAEQPVSSARIMSTVLSAELKELRKNIRELTRKYQEMHKNYYSLEERLRIESNSIQGQLNATKGVTLQVKKKVQTIERTANKTIAEVKMLNKKIPNLEDWRYEINNSVHRANISAMKNIHRMSNQINSSLYEYIDEIMGPLDSKIQEIVIGSQKLEELIYDLKHDLNDTQEKHAGSLDQVQSKIRQIDDGMKLHFLNISQILFTAISALKGTDNQTMEKLQKYNESINIMKGNLLGKIQHVNFTMQLLKSHTKNQSEEMQKQANVIRHLNEILNSTSLRMNAMKKELLQFRTEVLVNSGKWAPYNFSFHDITSDCYGTRYIKKIPYHVGRYVGVILCGQPERYKILLSNRMFSGYLDIADNFGSGDDHCEFVGSSRRTFNCKGSIETKEAFGRSKWGEEPKRQKVGFLNPTCSWYECGITIP
ncbi:Hypothetical predicted protein [Octopus vulgaris]|uniref:Target of Nesh-SH3/FNDC1 C-terminal domain-containing protein n=1 Tax=Octopus vulgaris TaxID=6645 RepID=A0AA36FDK8_OCTVU|nr:Hypothetical predicted protein [Octopus vulgaris]